MIFFGDRGFCVYFFVVRPGALDGNVGVARYGRMDWSFGDGCVEGGKF